MRRPRVLLKVFSTICLATPATAAAPGCRARAASPASSPARSRTRSSPRAFRARQCRRVVGRHGRWRCATSGGCAGPDEHDDAIAQLAPPAQSGRSWPPPSRPRGREEEGGSGDASALEFHRLPRATGAGGRQRFLRERRIPVRQHAIAQAARWRRRLAEAWSRRVRFRHLHDRGSDRAREMRLHGNGGVVFTPRQRREVRGARG